MASKNFRSEINDIKSKIRAAGQSTRRAPARTDFADDFTQPIKELQNHIRLTDQSIANATFASTIEIQESGFTKTLQVMRRLLELLQRNLDDLSEEGIKVIQERTIRRGSAQFPQYRYWYKLGNKARQSTGPSRTLTEDFQTILTKLAVVHKPSKGTAGFGLRSELDKIELRIKFPPSKLKRKEETSLKGILAQQLADDRAERKGKQLKQDPIVGNSLSPYKIAWQIIEFGTGSLAAPRRRGWQPNRPTKAQYDQQTPDSGAWYWLPNIMVYGQEGLHFLFGTAANQAAIAEDRRLAEEAIAKKLREIYTKGR